MVFSGLVTLCRLATWPTSRSPPFVKPTTDGVVRPPSWLGITTAWPASITDTTEFVVPKSMPMILLIFPRSPGLDSGMYLAANHYETLALYCQVSWKKHLIAIRLVV